MPWLQPRHNDISNKQVKTTLTCLFALRSSKKHQNSRHVENQLAILPLTLLQLQP